MYLVRHSLFEIESGRTVKKIAVIGIGQSMRGDDAVGLVAVNQWRKNFPETASRPEVQIEACELPGLALLDTLQDVESAILVDGIQSFTKPGTIHSLSEEQLAAFTTDAKSAHGWGVAETLELGRNLDQIKTALRIIAIEVEQTEVGANMSKTVDDVIPKTCEAIEVEINKFLE
jgi:hydrogenase maturation protease